MVSLVPSSPIVPSLHRLDAYQLSLQFRKHVVGVLPLRRLELSDQLDRASISVCLNLAEGVGRSGKRDQCRAYSIARGSAVECLAVLDLLDIEKNSPTTTEARATLLRLIFVVTRLINRR